MSTASIPEDRLLPRGFVPQRHGPARHRGQPGSCAGDSAMEVPQRNPRALNTVSSTRYSPGS